MKLLWITIIYFSSPISSQAIEPVCGLRLAKFTFPCLTVSQCEALDDALPGKVVYQGTDAYNISNIFWSSKQSSLTPACFVLPSSATDVSTIIGILTKLKGPFAVKAGGHTAFAGSNIQDGVTIDLQHMNAVNLAADRSSVSLGPGARWGDVAAILDPLRLAVVGGRGPTIGVGGFILGGGISFLSGRRGWACDNVQNFEVVLASGKIVNANTHKNSDLFWALRGGGGSNFGIVTRFDVNVYEQGDVWSRLTFWPYSEREAVLQEFTRLSRDVLHIDQDAHIFYHLAYLGTANDPDVVTFTYHLNFEHPVGGTFDTFDELARLPRQIFNNTLVTTLGGQLELIRDTNGGQRAFSVGSISGGPGSDQLLKDIINLWRDTADKIRTIARERNQTASFSFTVQALTTPTLEIMLRNGGNPLGLKPNGRFPVFDLHVLGLWEDPSLDRIIDIRWKAFFDKVGSMATNVGLGNEFKYMNYGGKLQDIYGSYGADNHERLRRVAKKYDQKRLLKDLWKGYYKL